MKFSAALSLVLAGAVSAAPTSCKARSNTVAAADTYGSATTSAAASGSTSGSDSSCSLSVTAAQIAQIAPATSSCASGGQCSNADTVAECVTKAACQYEVTKNEMMAVIALMAFESVAFAYKVNTGAVSDPADHAGQGTANMQMAGYNFDYAQSIPAVKAKLAYTSVSQMDYDALNNELLPAVTADEYNFGSGFWYLTQANPEKCPAARQALNSDLSTGFSTYITSCVGTTLTDQRTAYLTAVIKAFSSY